MMSEIMKADAFDVCMGEFLARLHHNFLFCNSKDLNHHTSTRLGTSIPDSVTCIYVILFHTALLSRLLTLPGRQIQ